VAYAKEKKLLTNHKEIIQRNRERKGRERKEGCKDKCLTDEAIW